MKLTLNISSQKLTQKLIISVIVLTLLSIGSQIGRYIFNYRSEWFQMFDLDREMNLPSWFSVFMLAICALLLKMITKAKQLKGNRYHQQWKLLSIIFVFLSFDELLSIHEILIIPEISQALSLPGFLRPLWVIPGSILVAYFFLKYWNFTFSLPNKIRNQFIFAALLYVSGTLIMEMIGGQYAYLGGRKNLHYALITDVEEVLEMSGIIVFIRALLIYLAKFQHYLQIQLNFESNTPK